MLLTRWRHRAVRHPESPDPGREAVPCSRPATRSSAGPEPTLQKRKSYLNDQLEHRLAVLDHTAQTSLEDSFAGHSLAG